VEAVPEGAVAFTFSDAEGVDKGLGLVVELVIVVDDVHFVGHVLLGIVVSKFN
jgi:hypothetical protein